MNILNEHRGLISELKKLEPKIKKIHYGDSYTGSDHFYYGVSVPKRRLLLKNWLKGNKKLSSQEIIELADFLFKGKSHEEKTMGGYLLSYSPKARDGVSLAMLNSWLDELNGWAEIDSLCQNIWQADELLSEWESWKKFLSKLSKDKNINKRRASLVLLVGPTWKCDDQRLHNLAYKNIERLKEEKDILITKAISWLLRSMADTRKKDVESYINKEDKTLPKIAIRETKKKLLTGKKN